MAYVGRSPRYGFLEGQTLTFNGSTTTVTLQRNVSSTDALDVYIDNVHQEPDVAYNLASGGNQITFTGTPANGQKLYIRFHGISFDTARASKLVNTDASSSLTLTDSHTLTLDLNGTTALTATTSGITIPNLTVTGTTTSVNSTNLEVGDNQITLNSDVDGSTAPTQDAGIVINRGSSADVSFLWDEGADYWLAADPIVSSERLSVFKSGTTPTLSSSTLGVFKSTATNESAAVSIIANSGQSSTLNFGDENDEDAGKLSYNHSSELFTVDVAGSMKLDADSSNFFFSDGGTDIGLLSVNNQDVNIRNLIADKDIYFQGNDSDGGGTFTALSLSMSNGGNATFSGSVASSGLTVAGSTSGTVDGLIITNSSTTNNGLSLGVDSNENAFAWNGSNTNFNFATNNALAYVLGSNHNFVWYQSNGSTVSMELSASGALSVTDTVTAAGVTVGNSNLGSNSSHLANITLNNNGYIGSANASTALQIQTSGNAVFSGNVGIGTAPAAWWSNATALQVSPVGALYNTSNYEDFNIANNAYFNSSGTESYIQNDAACKIRLTDSGLMDFRVAGSGSAGNAISWVTAMQMDASGGLVVNPNQNNNINFIAKAGSKANALVVDGQSGHLGLGAAPDTTGYGGTFQYLGVNGGSGYGVFNGQTTSTTAGDGAASFFASTTGSSGYKILGGMRIINGASSSSNAEGELEFWTSTGGSVYKRMTIDRAGATEFLGNVKASDILAKDSGGLTLQTDDGTKRLVIDDHGGIAFRTMGFNTHYFGGTNVVNGITAVPSPVGVPFTVGRDTGSNKSAHFAGNLKFDSGYGIDFSATSHTTSGSAGSEVLDNYEVGTFTPQIFYQNTSDQAAATNVTQSGRYIRIGTMVYVSFRLDWTAPNSPVNDNIGIKNLPFAGLDNNYNGGGGVITSSNVAGLQFQLPQAGSTIALVVGSDNVGNYGDEFGGGSNKYMRGSFTYFAQ